MNLKQHPHRRYNPLTGEWILCSPHRTERPWQGKVDSQQDIRRNTYDPKCYLCPGNVRANKKNNPDYKDTFVFINDFAALYPDIPDMLINIDNLIRAESEKGICKVICYSPFHNMSMALLPEDAIRKVVKTWIDEFTLIGAHPDINYIQIFENKGAIMGCSNPHPHGQIWANQNIPFVSYQEDVMQNRHFQENKTCLLCKYLEYELKEKTRIVIQNDSFCVLVPFWAVWPFEVMVLPKRHHTGIDEMDEKEIDDCADILKRLCVRYDNIFHTEFPFSMGIHQRPVTGDAFEYWHFHFHYYPRLLRSAEIQKFMVGYEMLAMPQRDITAEEAADRLRKQSEIHFITGK